MNTSSHDLLFPLRAAQPAPGRHAALCRLFALRAHERYLMALLARYDGPLHATWAAELARVRAALAER